MKVKEKLASLGVRPTKARGQNFLIDSQVIETILDFGAPTRDEAIIEIGPGLGALTEKLAKFPLLTVVEIEPEFCAELKRKFPGIVVVEGDIRETSLSDLGANTVVFGNLPYSFSTDIILKLVEESRSIKRAILLLQKEFALRLAAPPGGKDYGTLSVLVKLVSMTRLGPVVPGNCFHPPAGVESQLIELLFLSEPRCEWGEIKKVQEVVRASFLKRRKKLSNSLAASGRWSHEKIESALKSLSIDENRRGETLSVEEFIALSRALH